MDRAWLKALLDQGCSLAQIGDLLGKHPSTVGYWVHKHGLSAAHSEAYAPRGGIDRPSLAALVDQGKTVREIAQDLGVSYSTARYWLQRHGLATAATVLRDARRDGLLPRTAVHRCRHHGETEFQLEGRGYYRCKRCRAQAVSNRRRRVKQILVAEAGGACVICGYDRHPGVLEFHHVRPEAKSFSLSHQGVTRGIAVLREEARKCVLLCSNCHAEVERGIAEVPRRHQLKQSA